MSRLYAHVGDGSDTHIHMQIYTKRNKACTLDSVAVFSDPFFLFHTFNCIHSPSTLEKVISSLVCEPTVTKQSV